MVWTALVGAGGSGGGGGTGGAGYDFLFDPAAVQNPAINLYSVWLDLITAINAPNLPSGAPPVVTIGSNFVVPLAAMPVTGWPMNLAKLRAVSPVTGLTTLTIPAGVKLDMLEAIEHGLVVTAAPTVDGVFEWSLYAPGTVPRVLSVGLGAALQNLTPNASALILSPGAGTYVVLSSILAQYGSIPPSTGPFVRTVVGDVVIGNVSAQGGSSGKLPDGWLVGPVGSFLVYQMEVDAVAPATPGFLGVLAIPLTATQATTNPLAIKGAARTLIFTNEAITLYEVDTYASWVELYAVWTLLDAPKAIGIKPEIGTQLHVPAGTWDIEGASIYNVRGLSQPTCELVLDDGAVLHDLSELGETVTLIGQSTTPSLTFSPADPANGIRILKLNIGSGIRNDGPSVMVAWDKDSTTDVLIFGLISGNFISSAVPIVDVTPAGAFSSIVGIAAYEGAFFGSNVISGANAGGAAVIAFLVQQGRFDLLGQAGWAGAPLAAWQTFQVQSFPRVNIQTDAVVAGAYFVLNGSEFVRVAPDGSLTPIAITLPDPTGFPDETVLVKKTNAEIATAITVVAAGGSTIDGVLSYPLPATPYSMLRFVSDGANWWATS